MGFNSGFKGLNFKKFCFSDYYKREKEINCLRQNTFSGKCDGNNQNWYTTYTHIHIMHSYTSMHIPKHFVHNMCTHL